MGQQVASDPDLVLGVNDFTLIFPSFHEMIWLTVREKQIPLFVNTKSISCLTELSLTEFLLGERGLQSATGDKHGKQLKSADGKSASERKCMFGSWQLSHTAHKFTSSKIFCHD